MFAGMLGCADPPPAEPPDGFVPELLYVAGAFAYDPVEDEAIPYSVDGEVAPIRLDVTVLDRRYFEAGDSAWRCDLTATTTSRAPRAPWATDAGVAFGFTLPTDVEVARSSRASGPIPARDTMPLTPDARPVAGSFTTSTDLTDGQIPPRNR